MTFDELTRDERKKLRPYLLGKHLILEKHISLEEDSRSGKIRSQAEYRGYQATPKEWWLSTDSVFEHEGTNRPNWEEIATEQGIIDYVRDKSGRVNKRSYEAGLRQLLVEREDIEYNEPELGETQALGFQSVLLDELPMFRLLPAITDYSNEIDRRSSKTNFRLLMGDLAERILRYDPRYRQLENNLEHLMKLLNAPDGDEDREEGQERLTVLDEIETKLCDLISRLMPSVQGVQVNVEIDQMRDIFSRGVSINIDDGKLTEVIMKGHGLQRCVIFSLLQALILNQRGQLIEAPEDAEDGVAKDERPIILAIEEPELYIHPQMQRLIFGALKDFAQSDQVLFSTHSPAFVDVSNYETISIVQKNTLADGTKVKQCELGILDAETERKTFQFLSSFGLEQNQMFFAKKVILVEGYEDVIAVLATGRELSLFREFPEECGYTIVSTDSKQEMPKYMKLLNAFGIPYVVLQELDDKPADADENKKITDLLEGNRAVVLPKRLEDALGHDGHFRKSYHAKKFFENPDNINEEFKQVVVELFD